MLTTEIKSMPVADRIMLMEEIWDSLCHEAVEISSPYWHKEILVERMELVKSKQAALLTIEELKNTNR